MTISDSISLQAAPRSTIGKQVRFLRRAGITPIHLYGKETDSLALQVDSAVLLGVIAQAGRTAPISVTIEGNTTSHFAFIREVQRHPVTEAVLHVDFYQVPITETMHATVPVILIGDAPAVRLLSGNLTQALNTIEVECLPLDVPQVVEVDISGLANFEQGIYVSSLDLGRSVTILTAAEELIVRVNPPRVEVEAAVGEAGVGEAAADGEAPETVAGQGRQTQDESATDGRA
jgi:large subunit ribosomal protein L25